MPESANFVVGSIRAPGYGAHAGEMDSFYLIERSGEDGRCWVRGYRESGCVELDRTIESALVSLRNREQESGCRLLSEAEARLGDLRDQPESVVRILEHRYYGVLAYARYCEEDLDGATRFVSLAEECLRRALDRRPYLVPLAARFLDFSFQRLRIARNRRLWADVKSCIETLRLMLSDEVPLCILSDGSAISISTLIHYYDSFDLRDEERQFVDRFFSEEFRLKDLERSIYKIYALSGPVIPYP